MNLSSHRTLRVCEEFFTGLLLAGAEDDPGLAYDWGESRPFALAVGEAECDNGTLREIARESATQEEASDAAVTPTDLEQWLQAGRAVVVDVRTAEEVVAGHIPGARWVPGARLDVCSVASDKVVVLVCRTGGRSRAALKIWQGQGVNGVVYLKGGMEAWSGPVTNGTRDMATLGPTID